MADLDESARFATDIVAESDTDKVRVANELSEQVIGIVPKVDSCRPSTKGGQSLARAECEQSWAHAEYD